MFPWKTVFLVEKGKQEIVSALFVILSLFLLYIIVKNLKNSSQLYVTHRLNKTYLTVSFPSYVE